MTPTSRPVDINPKRFKYLFNSVFLLTKKINRANIKISNDAISISLYILEAFFEKMKGFNESTIRIFMKSVLSCKKSESCLDKKVEASKYKVCVKSSKGMPIIFEMAIQNANPGVLIKL